MAKTECGKDEIRLIVKSKRIPYRIETVRTPRLAGTIGTVYMNERRDLYSDSLDEEQTKALDSARELAASSGMKLVVEDTSMKNPLLRAMKRLTKRNMPCNAMLVLPCEANSSSVRSTAARNCFHYK